MRYSQDHKAQTHQRIIREAAARFRRDGIGATGLQPLMKALGLTHGGFYSHFASKDELVEKALQAAGEEVEGVCAMCLPRNGRLKPSSTAISPNGINHRRIRVARCQPCHRNWVCADSPAQPPMPSSMQGWNRCKERWKVTTPKIAALSSCRRWSAHCCCHAASRIPNWPGGFSTSLAITSSDRRINPASA